MLQRINTCVMTVVLIAIAALSVQMWANSRTVSTSLELLSAQIEQMRRDAEASRPSAEAVARARIISLRFADAKEVSDVVSRTFGAKAPDPAKRDVVLEVDARTNSLLVAAETGVWEEIVEAVKDLDLDAAGARSQAFQTRAERETALREAATPVGSRLAPGDAVTIEVYGLVKPDEWFRATRTIEADGMLRLPIIGDVEATGRTPREVEADVLQRAAEIVVDPVVSVYPGTDQQSTQAEEHAPKT